MEQTIVIEIATDGAVQLKTQGFEGPACLAASRELEAALGLTENEELLPEYFDVNHFHLINKHEEIRRAH